tara:strand:- start:69 stop:458 length:390 start_codon:yes stop_codon:yes gene_type:complete
MSATWTIQIPRNQYPSLQVGDIVYFKSADNLNVVDGFQQFGPGSIELGDLQSINNTTSLDDGTQTTTLVINVTNTNTTPSINDFLFFVKDNRVNITSLLGYFAKMKFENDANSKVELFSISTEINESSK